MRVWGNKYIIPKKIYKCEHCNKLYQKKYFAEIHEKQCNKNPANNRACLECNHLTKKDTVVYYDNYYGDMEEGRNVNLFYCPKIDAFLYPPKVEYKNNRFEFEDDLNQPMPKECEHQDNPYPKILDHIIK